MSNDVHYWNNFPKYEERFGVTYDVNKSSPELRGWTAHMVSKLSKGYFGEKVQMIPVTYKEVLAKHKSLVKVQLRFNARDEIYHHYFTGYIGAKAIEEHAGNNFSEVGTLYVPKKYRGHKIATGLVQLVTKQLEEDGTIPYAFTNPKSYPIFKKLGYKEADPEQLPGGIFLPCAKCPNNPGNGSCCDTPMIKEIL